MRSLTFRAILITCTAALISVLVTAVVAAAVAVQVGNRQARASMADQTSMLTVVLRPRIATARTADEEAALRQLQHQGVEVYVIRNGQPDRAGLPASVVNDIKAGRTVDTRALVGGKLQLIYGRPLLAGGNGVVLTRDPVAASLHILGDLWLALLAGLAAGTVAGALLARRLARPIASVAHAAARLSAGDRTVRLKEDPLTEVAELARAFNRLAEALAVSEGRQRDFLLSVSHELRTPLTTIKGYAEALADGVVGSDSAPRVGATMLDEAARLDRLVADLLVLARLEAADLPLELMPVDLTELIGAAAEVWGGRCAPIGVLLRTELPGYPVMAQTDPGRVRQIIDGLCENALRVLPPGAPLILAVRPPAPAGPGAAVRLSTVEIRDGGPGFTDDDLAVAFERGALSQRYQGIRKVGSGLGLALAARLVRRLGGTIEAGHAPEGGARFTVGLPGGGYPVTRASR